ncbi:MAG: quinone oxidoreductase [Nevskia sp.]|nr:quinone oxidoreductase [Nevskia sp.]
MALSVRIEQHGGPEVMQLVEAPLAPPAAGEVSLQQHAVGLNFIDTYQRSGLYPIALPSGLGQEAAGVVTAVGAGVEHLRVGDRVAYAGGPAGAYAAARVLPAARLVKLPEGIASDVAAALLLKGMTAYYLLHMTFVVKSGHRLLVHAAAGGVGSVLVPWAKSLGAEVIGTVGSLDKAAHAQRYGCDAVIIQGQQDIAKEVKRFTGGTGVDVVYDSVGKDSFAASLDSLRPRGLLVSYGNASGKPPAVDPGTLMTKGSLFLTRPTLAHYTANRTELETAAHALFKVIADGTVKAEIGQRFPLRDVQQAHRDMEARNTRGASLLIP